MEDIKISVVTICYNCEKDIQRTIDSVVSQSYSNIEYIIIDGASKDKTVDIIKANENNISVWVSEPDKGIYDAMNKGIRLATGDYINFLNAGDIYHSPESVSLMFNKPTNADILYGTIHFITQRKTIIVKPFPLKDLEKKMIMGHPSVFAKGCVIKELMFDTSYRSSGDFDFLYRCYQQGKTFECRDVVVADFDGTDGISNNNPSLVLRENARIIGVDKNISWKILFYCTILKLTIFKFIIKLNRWR